MSNLNINFDDYEAVIFSDGSGTVFDKPCGWATVYYCCRTNNFWLIGGTETHGTNNFAELYPTLKALWVHRNRYLANASERILIVSDSEWTVKTGNGEYAVNTNNANSILWAAVDFARKNWSYSVSFVHVPRNSNSYNKFCDEVAGHLRKSLLKEVEECQNRLKELTKPLSVLTQL